MDENENNIHPCFSTQRRSPLPLVHTSFCPCIPIASRHATIADSEGPQSRDENKHPGSVSDKKVQQPVCTERGRLAGRRARQTTKFVPVSRIACLGWAWVTAPRSRDSVPRPLWTGLGGYLDISLLIIDRLLENVKERVVVVLLCPFIQRCWQLEQQGRAQLASTSWLSSYPRFWSAPSEASGRQ